MCIGVPVHVFPSYLFLPDDRLHDRKQVGDYIIWYNVPIGYKHINWIYLNNCIMDGNG